MQGNESSHDPTWALHEANETLRAIFDSIKDYAVFTLDLEGMITNWNAGAERVFGWTEEEAIGQSGEMIFTPEDRADQAPEKELRGALEKGFSEDIRWHLRKDGSRFFANGTMRQLRDHEGNLRGVIKVTRDATGELVRQQAEAALLKSEEKYRSLFDSLDSGFCIIEVHFDENEHPLDYLFIEVNPSFEAQTGIKNAVGRWMREIEPDIEDYWSEIYGRVAKTGESIRFENRAEPLHRYYETYAFRVGDPREHHVAILFNEVNERKKREQNARFLADLGDDFARSSSANEIMRTLGEKLYHYFDLNRLTFSYIDEAADLITTVYEEHDPNLNSALGAHRLSDFISADYFGRFKEGHVVAVNDVDTDPHTAANAESYRAFSSHAQLLAPFISEGHWGLVVIFHKAEPYTWHDEEIDLLQVLASRIALSLERVRAETEQRELRGQAERQRLARDLHDAVSQTLFSASIITETLPRLWEQNPSQIPEIMTELYRLIRGAQAEMRTLLLELRPANLQTTPLSRLLRQLVDTVQGRKYTKVSLTFEGEPVLPPEVHIVAYRIVQEAMNNLTKHANAQEAWVVAQGGTGFIDVHIRDNGAGFDIEMPKSGLGLQMMRERAESIGAQLEVQSTVDSGTDVHLVWSRTETPQL